MANKKKNHISVIFLFNMQISAILIDLIYQTYIFEEISVL
jgi:hypothetical protein